MYFKKKKFNKRKRITITQNHDTFNSYCLHIFFLVDFVVFFVKKIVCSLLVEKKNRNQGCSFMKGERMNCDSYERRKIQFNYYYLLSLLPLIRTNDHKHIFNNNKLTQYQATVAAHTQSICSYSSLMHFLEGFSIKQKWSMQKSSFFFN